MTSDGGDDPSKKPVDPTIQKQSVELTPEELVLLKKIRAMELADREPTDIKDPKRAGYPLGREMAHFHDASELYDAHNIQDEFGE